MNMKLNVKVGIGSVLYYGQENFLVASPALNEVSLFSITTGGCLAGPIVVEDASDLTVETVIALFNFMDPACLVDVTYHDSKKIFKEVKRLGVGSVLDFGYFGEHIIARYCDDKARLISLVTGNRWSNNDIPVTLEYVHYDDVVEAAGGSTFNVLKYNLK